MGRKKLNRTKEELDELNRIRLRRYYERHKDEVKQRNLKRYFESKERNLQDNKQD
jgi:hypothetical protein